MSRLSLYRLGSTNNLTHLFTAAVAAANLIRYLLLPLTAIIPVLTVPPFVTFDAHYQDDLWSADSNSHLLTPIAPLNRERRTDAQLLPLLHPRHSHRLAPKRRRQEGQLSTVDRQQHLSSPSRTLSFSVPQQARQFDIPAVRAHIDLDYSRRPTVSIGPTTHTHTQRPILYCSTPVRTDCLDLPHRNAIASPLAAGFCKCFSDASLHGTRPILPSPHSALNRALFILSHLHPFKYLVGPQPY
ncbi:hypothetical protein V8E36_000704 [Tilletia maclaganii]